MRFLAVDPGKTTGVALWTGKPETWQLPCAEAQDLCHVLISPSTIVVCESFIPRPGAKTWQPDAIETIGMLRAGARWQRCLFELQSPADAKRFSTNEKLKKLGWYTPTQGGHINDALRHLLLAMVRHQAISVEELI